MPDLAHLDAHAQAELVRTGEASPLETARPWAERLPPVHA